MKKIFACFLVLGNFVMAGPGYAESSPVPQDLFAYETPANIKVGAVFGRIDAVTKTQSAVTGVKTSVCDKAEIHSMTHEGGIMKMRQVDKVAMEKGQVQLTAMGYHIMLMELRDPLKKGDILDMT